MTKGDYDPFAPRKPRAQPARLKCKVCDAGVTIAAMTEDGPICDSCLRTASVYPQDHN